MNSYLVLYLLTGMKGGIKRIEIIKLIMEKELNANQIKEKTGLDYKTVQHHLRVLSKHRFIVPRGEKYGAQYELTDEFRVHLPLFKEILAKINKSNLGK